MAQWKEITQDDEWKNLLTLSAETTVLLMKHSTTCPISAAAWSEYLSYLASDSAPQIEYRMVKVIESRPVSNQIAEDLGVPHASPQAILIKNGQAVWNASHGSITENRLSKAVASLK